MINWDNYPNNKTGGVYAWARDLVSGITDYQFVIVNCLSNPNINSSCSLPKNVIKIIEMPLFGCQRYEEFLKQDDDDLPSKIIKTNKLFIERSFIPLYHDFIYDLVSETSNHKRLQSTILKLHHILVDHDVKKCLEDPSCFKMFSDILRKDDLYQHVPLRDAVIFYQLIQRMIQVLAIKLPRVDIIHASNAWFPALIGIYAKEDNQCPFIITEHGVAFKDLLLYHRLFMRDGASNILWKVLSSNLIRTISESADLMTPVCHANAVTEQALRIDKSKIRVIYNGVDTIKFRSLETQPLEVQFQSNVGQQNEAQASHNNVVSESIKAAINNNTRAKRPTIVYVGRIELLKDLVNLIEAVRIVKEEIPDILCLIYGASTDLEYARKLSQLVSELELEDNVKFMGKTDRPENAYNLADVVALSSLREGFPYAIIEAMACGKAIVSTDVGGVREALENYGLLVKSRHTYSLAQQIIKLLRDGKLRKYLGEASVKRATQKFSLQRSISEYKKLYSELTSNSAPTVTADPISILSNQDDVKEMNYS